jgi:hypothetical protein
MVGRCWSAPVRAYPYPIPGRCNGFTSTARATTWFLDLSSVAKDKPAFQTFRRFQEEIPSGISCKGSDHMLKVVLHLSLRKPQPFRKLA